MTVRTAWNQPQHKADSDENGYLRRRLEAIERTTLKLNIGGVSSDLQILRERLDLESAEVVRLREAVAALQKDKLALSEVGGGGRKKANIVDLITSWLV